MNITFVSSEVYPYVKTGGLADVIGALSNSFKKLKHQVCVFMPYYPNIMDTTKYPAKVVKTDLWIQMGDEKKGFAVRKYKNVYFIEHDYYFARAGVYGENNEGYFDNGERFVFFSQAVLLAMKALDIKSDIIHNNDWQTGLVPLYLKVLYKNDKFFENVKTIFTLHNIEYQGIFPKDIMSIANIPWTEFTMQKLEYFDHINCLKAGIVYSNIVTTVSPKYAEEIKSNALMTKFLDSVLKLVNLVGIINGIDYSIWNPKIDDKIIKNYDSEKLANKKFCKQDLLNVCKIKENKDGLVLAIISRFVKAKGFDVICSVIEKILDIDEKIRLVVLGTGEKEYEKFFKYLDMKYTERVSINIKFDAGLAHKIYAGADILIMPSEYEACGLTQMIAYRYGVVPVVNDVGGLHDTVVDYNEKTKTGTGFVMKEYSSDALYQAICRAFDLYCKNRKIEWNKLVKNNMKLDFSWKKSAKEYLKIYEK